MPSPVGHALGGFIAGGAVTLLAGELVRRRTAVSEALWLTATPAILLLAALGALPDVDFLVGRHSRETHSIGAVTLIALIVWLRHHAPRGTAVGGAPADGRDASVNRTRGPAVGARQTPHGAHLTRALGSGATGVLQVSRATWTVACAAAYASHIVLDWLGSDTAPPIGIQALWPLSQRYFESSWHLFYAVDRRYWLPSFLAGAVRTVGWELAVLGPLAAAVWWGLRHRRRTST